MQFESTLKRNFFINILAGFLPDMFLAIILAMFTGSGFLGFIGIFAVFELFPLPIWIARSVFGWLDFFIRGKRLMATVFLHNLQFNKFPRPRNSEESPEGYYERIANDETLPCNLRLAAARECWMLEIFRAKHEMQSVLKFQSAHEMAIQDYSKSAPFNSPHADI